MNRLTRCLIVVLALLAPIMHATPTAAAPRIPTTYPVIGRVVDGDGRVQRPSELVACPIVGTTPDCAHRVVATTGPLGFAVLKLNKAVRYRLLAAVTNPDPAWACPGLPFEGDVVYLSNESFDGLPSELPQLATFTIVEPRPGDCAPITVTDDAGNPLPGAGVFINGDSGNGPTDANGIVTVKVAAGATYEIRAYLPNSGWPCPSNTQPDGSTYHFSDTRTVTAEELVAGTTTFVIPKPTPYDCVSVHITDDAGNPVPNAGLFVDDGFGPRPADAQGNIELAVTPGTSYQVGAFLANSDWPCPTNTQPGGSTFHVSERRTVTAEELVAGTTTFVIVKPRPEDCVNVKIIDDAGNPVPNAGLFVDDGFSSPSDAQGNIQLAITPDTSYRIGAFVGNTGWPCPAFTSPDGTTFHFSDTRTVTTEQLLAGQTFVIRQPDASECAPRPTGMIRMFDESGAALPLAIVSYCEYDPATPPSYPNDPNTDCVRGGGFQGPDGDGIIRIPVTDLNSTIDVTGFLACTAGGFLFGDFNHRTPDGYTFWRISATDLVTNGLDLAILGDTSACLAPVASP